VLTDHYLGYGDYSHVPQQLLLPGARLPFVLDVVARLNADIIGIQEADLALVTAFDAIGEWQVFWSPKNGGKPDGCLTLVKHDITTSGFWSRFYSDDSGHVAQSVTVGDLEFVNTHIKWPPDTHGSVQVEELLGWLGRTKPAVVMTDCNDRPHGPVRALFDEAGFVNTCGFISTALVDGKLAALDLLTVRGTRAEHIETGFDPTGIPSITCPSDHIPVVANVETN
jgi:hypothetical protein